MFLTCFIVIPPQDRLGGEVEGGFIEKSMLHTAPFNKFFHGGCALPKS